MAIEDITIVLVGENSLINTNDTAFLPFGILGEESVEIIGDGTASLYVESAIGIEAVAGVLSINGVDLEVKAWGEWSALRGEELDIVDSNVKVTTTNVLYGEGMCGNTITIKGSDVTVTSNYKAVTGGKVSIIDSTVTLSSEQYAINADDDIEIKNSTFNASIPDNFNYLEMFVIMTDGNFLIEKSTANITTGETSYSSYGIEADTVTFDNSFVTLDTASGACKTTNGVTVTNASVYDDDSQVDAPDASTYSGNYVKLVPLCSVTVHYGIDGVDNEEIRITKGNTISLENPVIGGYLFIGWFTDDTYQTPFDPTAPITESITIYAKYADYEDDKEALNNEIDAAKAELQGKIDAVESALASKADAATLNAAIADLQAAIDALEAVKDDYATADATLRAELETAIATAKSDLETLIGGVQSDLDTTKAKLDKAIDDLNKAITDGDKNLSDKIAALNTALTNAKAALEKADSDNKATLEAKIEATEATLDAAIKAVQKNLDNAKEELNKAIADGDTKLDGKITALGEALETAKATLEATDSANKSELTTKIDEANAALQAAINALSNELNATNEKVAELETFIIIVCVIAGVAFCGCGTLAVFYIIDKKKKI